MKKTNKLLVLLAAVSIAVLSIGPARAYFTDSTRTDGADTVVLGSRGTITEQMEQSPGAHIKKITVTNTGDVPMFVRARVFYAPDLTVAVSGWIKQGTDPENGYETAYYLYDGIVEPGETASGLTVTVTGFPTDGTAGDKRNVVVVYESVPVFYNEQGEAVMNWDQAITFVGTEG